MRTNYIKCRRKLDNAREYIIKKICKLLVNGCIPLSRIQRKKLSPLAVKTLRDISSIENAQLGIKNYPGLEKTLKVVLPIVVRFIKNF